MCVCGWQVKIIETMDGIDCMCMCAYTCMMQLQFSEDISAVHVLLWTEESLLISEVFQEVKSYTNVMIFCLYPILLSTSEAIR